MIRDVMLAILAAIAFWSIAALLWAVASGMILP